MSKKSSSMRKHRKSTELRKLPNYQNWFSFCFSLDTLVQNCVTPPRLFSHETAAFCTDWDTTLLLFRNFKVSQRAWNHIHVIILPFVNYGFIWMPCMHAHKALSYIAVNIIISQDHWIRNIISVHGIYITTAGFHAGYFAGGRSLCNSNQSTPPPK